MAIQYKTINSNNLSDWIKNNPGKKYKVNGVEYTAGSENEDYGTIGNILKSISSPFRAALSMPEYIYQNLTGSSDYNKNNFKSIFLTPSEEAAYQEDPLKAGSKSIAGLASWLIPGGASSSATTSGAKIGSAALKGAAQGTLAGYGASQTGEELKSALSGGALGGLLGGTLQGISEGTSSLSKRISNKTSNITDQNVKNLGVSSKTISDMGGLDNVKDSASVFYRTADDLGLPIANRYQRADALNEMLNQYGQEVSDILDSSSATISTKNIISAIDSNQKLKLAGLDDTKFIDSIKSIISSEGDYISASATKSLIGQIDDLAGGFSKVSGDVSSQRNTILKEVRNILRTNLGEAVPEVNLPLSAQSSLLDIASDIYKQAGKTSNYKIPVLNIGINGSTGLTKISDAIANATANKVGTSNLGSNLLNILGKTSSAAQNVIPAITNATQGVQPSTTENTVSGGTDNTNTSGLSINKLALAQAVLNGDISSTDASYITELLGGTTSENSGIQNTVQSAINMIDQYGSNVAGKGATITGKIGEFFGGASEGTTYRALISNIRTQLIKEIAGTNQTAAEMKNLRDKLPQPTDEPEVAKAKLQALNDSLGTSTTSTSDSTSALYQLLGLE